MKENISKRTQIKEQLEKEKSLQPNLLKSVEEKFNSYQKMINEKSIILKKLKFLPLDLELILKQYSSRLSILKKDNKLLKEYYLVISIFIIQINKYCSPIKEKFLNYIIDQKFQSLNFAANPIHDLIYSEDFIVDLLG